MATLALLVLLSMSAFAQLSPSGRAPTQNDFDACRREAGLSAGSASPGNPSSAAGATGGTGAMSGGSTLTPGGASAATDSGLRGTQPAQTDPGYEQVVRDCLARRGYVQ